MFINSYYRNNNYKLIENFEDLLIEPSECKPTEKKFYSERRKINYCYDPNSTKRPIIYSLPTECLSGYEKTNNMCKKIQAPATGTSSAPATAPATNTASNDVPANNTAPASSAPNAAPATNTAPNDVPANNTAPASSAPNAVPGTSSATAPATNTAPASSAPNAVPASSGTSSAPASAPNAVPATNTAPANNTAPASSGTLSAPVASSGTGSQIEILKSDINNIIEVPSKCNNNEILKNNNCYTPSGNLLGPSFCDANYIKIGGTCRTNINTNANTNNNNTNNSKIILSNPSTLDKNISNYFGIYNMPKSYFEPVYGYPLYYWEGLQQIDNNLDVINRLTLSDNVKIDNSKYNNIFNKRYLIIINNTSITNNIPTNYATFRLPIDPNTHNSIFIQTITRARWNNINMCICDPNTKKPIKKIITTSNTFNNVQNNGNSSFLGPYNNNAIQGFYEWLSFGISKTLINNYKTINNEIYVSINCGKESLENIILSGIAVCQNPYGITTIPAINLFWGNNGVQQQIDNIWTEKGIKYNNVILEESCVEILPNDVFKIKLPVLSNNKGLIIGFILNNNLWYDGNIQIYLLDNKYYELSPLIIGRYGTANLARGVYRYPKGFYIPNITNYVKIDDNGMSYIDIIIDNSKDINSTSIRGIYTELAEPE